MRRTKKTIMEEMAARISGLEQSLSNATEEQQTAETNSEKSPAEAVESPVQAQSAQTPFPDPDRRLRDDVLVQAGSSSQYFNEVLLSRVLEEVSLALRIK